MSPPAVTIPVNVPSTLLAEAGISQQDAAQALLRSFVLSLYRRERISSAKAAELLEMDRLDFLRLLAAENLPYFDYTTEELDQEFAVAELWPQK